MKLKYGFMNELFVGSPGLDADDNIVTNPTAATLPGAVRSPAMPDAHGDYGLPIGGVVAIRLDDMDAAVCPSVGFDINLQWIVTHTAPSARPNEAAAAAM